MAQAERGRAAERRVRRSREDGRALVQEWRSSNQTLVQFCQERGLAVHRLRYWRRRIEDEPAPDGQVSAEFLALGVARRAEANAIARSDAAGVLEIRATDSVLVRVPLAAGHEVFVQTLRGVLEALAS